MDTRAEGSDASSRPNKEKENEEASDASMRGPMDKDVPSIITRAEGSDGAGRDLPIAMQRMHVPYREGNYTVELDGMRLPYRAEREKRMDRRRVPYREGSDGAGRDDIPISIAMTVSERVPYREGSDGLKRLYVAPNFGVQYREGSDGPIPLGIRVPYREGSDGMRPLATGVPYRDNALAFLKNSKAVLAEEDEEKLISLPVIPRANAFLRNLKSEHFESTVVSLGLFHRLSRDSFRDSTRKKPLDVRSRMDSLKVDVLVGFLADIGRPGDLLEISREVVDAPICMKDLYDPRCLLVNGLANDRQKEIIETSLALDAIFVACFLLFLFVEAEGTYSLDTTFLRLFRVTKNLILREALIRDIFNMESQIPLVLLKNVVSIVLQNTPKRRPTEEAQTSESEHSNMGDLDWMAVDSTFQKMCLEVLQHRMIDFPRLPMSKLDLKFDECHHLLHVVAQAFRSAASASAHSSKESRQNKSREPRRPISESNARARYFSCLPRATELDKRGVTFEGHEGFSPQFKPGFLGWAGTLFLPQIEFIGDTAEQAWRNLVAWEHDFKDGLEGKPFTNYLNMMDDLIDTERDVSCLRKGKSPVIVVAGIGDNRAVANLFNSVTKHTFPDYSEEWLSTFEDVNNFQNQTFGRMAGEFVETYLSRPWLVISVLAAIILLVATILQTVYSVKSYYI